MSKHQSTNSNAPLLPEGRIELSQIIKQEKEQIWISPVCEFFNISSKWQQEVIRKDPFLSSEVRKNSNETLFGDRKARVSLTKKAFIRWIQLINPETVRVELREKLIAFQSLVFDYLYGAAEQQQEEALLYAEIQNKRAERAKLAKEIRQAETKLNRIYAVKFGQQQLQLADNIVS